MTTTTMNKIKNHGRAIKRIREMRDMKQQSLGDLLGKIRNEVWDQKKISALEAKEAIEPNLLADVSKALGVTPESIENFDESVALNVFANTFNSNDTSTLNAINYGCTFNPIDKIVEILQEQNKVKDEMIRELINKLAK
ncbi:helix-turn-helix domain-containing protein [Chitinophaga filiformis]|uniref:Helix-turn-helix domain-containing protein n=1 Tax=Chitinophaga filiformis TaxID=104663 RepID=A0ABY4I9E0_CHIFI|nr:helix-turn-helix transcriptional regulator [Chitinophaga filiformis]UPK72490.1 helix-turn-helix domain-containing protein [Chitinophaga filiformis]